jgi:hypothetical protein
MPPTSAMAAKAAAEEFGKMSREGFAVLAAQTGDMHVSWVAFPSDAEEQCSPHRFVTPAPHANHHQQTSPRRFCLPQVGATVPFGISPSRPISRYAKNRFDRFCSRLEKRFTPNADRAKANAAGI